MSTGPRESQKGKGQLMIILDLAIIFCKIMPKNSPIILTAQPPKYIYYISKKKKLEL